MRLYTKEALAKALGLTVGEVENLRKAGVIAYRKGKTFELEESAAAIIAHAKEKWGEEKQVQADYATERALLMRAKRMEQEYEMGLKEGKLHTAEDVERVVTAMLLNFRSRVMAIPSRLAARLSMEKDTMTIFNILKEATDDVLMQLSDYDTLFENDDD